MAFLVIAGQTIRVASGGQNAQDPHRMVGEEAPAFSGKLRNSFRAEKRNWKFQSALLIESDLDTLLTNTTLGAYVTCTGDALLGASVTCRVTVGPAAYVYHRGGFRRQAMIALAEQ